MSQPSEKSDRPFRSLPRLPRQVLLLPRARAYLDRWAGITVVRGIQGYGKTTLAGAWLRDQPQSVRSAWVGLGLGDGDGPAFCRRLAYELEASGLLGPGSASADPFELLDRATASLPHGERLVLVIDGAYRLQADELLGRLVNAVARHPQLHVLLCSRGQHPIERVAAGAVDLVTVPARVLLFTAAEIHELATRCDVPLSMDQAEKLHATFGGWPAAVRLVLEEIDGPASELPVARGKAYLRDTVLSGIRDQHMLRQVMRFSLAERLTHRLITDLADRQRPDQLIRLIESPGLAERVYDGGDLVLVFPSFVRDALRTTFAAREPGAAGEMHGALSNWYATHDGPRHHLLALRHAVAGQDWYQLDRIWARHSAEFGLEDPRELWRVLQDVPRPVLDARPGLSVGRRLAEVAAAAADSDQDGRTSTLRAYVEASTRAASAGLSALPLHDLLYVGTGHIVGLRLAGRFNDATDTAEEIAIRVAAMMSDGADPGDRLGWFYLQRGLTETLRGNHADATRWYRVGWQRRDETAAHIAGNLAANLAMTHALAAAPHEARRWIDLHRRIDVSRSWGVTLIDIGAHLAAGIVALDRLDRDACRAALDVIGDGSAPVELWPYVAYLRAEFGLSWEDPLVTLALLNAAQAAHPVELARGQAAVSLLGRARADLLLALGQAHRARSLLTGLGAEQSPTLAVPLARLLLLAGELAGARQVAAHLLWHKDTDNRARMDLLLINALADRRLAELASSRVLTRQALALYQHTRLLRPFSLLPYAELIDLFDTAGEGLNADDLETVRANPTPFPPRAQVIRLTRREQMLAAALAKTASRQEIADQLYVSINTVRKQLVTLYRKLGVQTRAQALAQLAQLGLAPEPALTVVRTPEPQP